MFAKMRPRLQLKLNARRGAGARSTRRLLRNKQTTTREEENQLSLNEVLRRENEALKAALKKTDAEALARVMKELGVEEVDDGSARVENGNGLWKKKKNGARKAVSAEPIIVDVDPESIPWPSPDESPPFWERPHRAAATAAGVSSSPAGADTRAYVPGGHGERMNIVHVTAEMAPIAKVGGLGDAVAGLARACVLQGHNVEVVLPFYDSMDETGIENLNFEREMMSPTRNNSMIRVEVFTGVISGVPVLLLRPENHYFNGGRIYGGSYNELEAYLFFCRATLELLAQTGREPAIIHLHDWHTSAVAMLYWEVYHSRYERLRDARIVLTIHNMENSGECRDDEFEATGIKGDAFLHVDKALDERTIGHNPERLSLMKGGVVYSNRVSTVSPTYAQETIHHHAAGFLGPTLAKFQNKYSGVLNGIDYELWDPATDLRLPAPYSAASPEGKKLCKRYLQAGLGLRVDADTPLIACVTRLVPQKGIHLIRHAVHRAEQQGAQFVLLGSAPDAGINGEFLHMADEFGHRHPSVRLMVMYSEDLAHLIYSGSDIFLVPSIFEPCGLTQMIAMRYGALPCVRRTGGLNDTVYDVDDGNDLAAAATDEARGNGFVFDGVDEGSLDGALDRAIAYYREQREWWDAMVVKVMKVDHSWSRSADTYVDLYRQSKSL